MIRYLYSLREIPTVMQYEGVACQGDRVWSVRCADCGGYDAHAGPSIGNIPQSGYAYIMPENDADRALRELAGKALCGWVCPKCMDATDDK